MGFTKLDDGLIFSSILSEDDAVFKVWVLILSRTDGDGVARISASFIASVTRKADAEVERCLQVLEAPDPRSRSTNDDGRRIERVNGGFKVLNYHKYRERDIADTLRTHERERKRSYRTQGTSGTPIKGYVYFLQAGDSIKVGFSVNPWSRAKELQTGNAEKGVLLGTIKGTQYDEAAIHEKFSRFRLNGEWFRADPELLDYVATYCGTVAGLSASASPSVVGSPSKLEGGPGGDPNEFFPRHPLPKANPLVAGRRPQLELECEALAREIAKLTGEDTLEVMAGGSHYEGARRTAINPANMTDDRLANTVRDLRRDLAELNRRRDSGAPIRP